MQRDGIQVNNPNRVPSTLSAIDGPQEGGLRVIRPITIVGSPVNTEALMPYVRAENDLFEVPEDGTYIDDRGNPLAFKKGDKIPLARAARFADFKVSIEDAQVSGLVDARMDLEPLENRKDPVPDNRTTKTTTKKAE